MMKNDQIAILFEDMPTRKDYGIDSVYMQATVRLQSEIALLIEQLASHETPEEAAAQVWYALQDVAEETDYALLRKYATRAAAGRPTDDGTG